MNEIEKYYCIYENSYDAILITKPTGEIISANPAACRLFGRTEEELCLLGRAELVDQNDPAYINGLITREQTGFVETELTFSRKDGTLFTGELQSNIFTDDLGNKTAMVFIRDITERKKTKLELLQHKEQLALFIEHSPAALAMLDKDMRYIATSRRWLADYKLGDISIIGKTHYEVFPEITQNWRDIHARCLNGVVEKSDEDFFIRQNGTKEWLKWEIRPWHNSKGEIGGIIMLTEVITERKNAEEEVKMSENRFRLLADNALIGIYILKEGRFSYVNKAMAKIFGYSISEMIGMEPNTIVHHSYQSTVAENINNRLTGAVNSIHYEVKGVHKNGSVLDIEIFGSRTELNGMHAIIGNLIDITERKRYEEQSLLITSIVNSTNDAIISKSVNGIITSWNQAAEKILGYSAEEIIGKHILTLIPDELHERDKEITDTINNGASINHYETYRRRNNGDIICVSLTVSPIFDTEGKVIGASKILRDISPRKAMELEREKILVDIIERNKNLEQFSYIVSHNLRAHVANILGISNLLKDETLEKTEEKTFTDGLYNSVEKLDTVIRDLNNVLELKNQSTEQRETIQITELLDNIKHSLSIQIAKTNTQILCEHLEVNDFTTINSYLYSILFNLISNSIKYRKENVAPVIEIKSRRSNNKIELTISDNGLGIDMQKKGQEVFGLYRRFHHHVEGKGVGLFMVKTQVEALGGKIYVESALNAGTTFTILFEQSIV